MNIQEIDKWLDNEYGCSYTRLEELHDFVVEQDLKHREEADKEIERLKNINEEHRILNGKLRVENSRLNNIINELEKELDLNLPFKVVGVRHLKKKLQELKGSDKK